MLYGYLYERFLEAKTMKSFFCLLLILLSVSVLQVKTQDSDVTCTLGRTDLEETSANPTPGLFIDLDNPATCSGQVLQWRLCYYNPSNFHSERDLIIGLQVWRFDQPQRRGSLVGENVLPITIPIPEELENFQCITLDPSEDVPPLNVTEGDLLGVTLRQDLVLPVIANGPNQSPAPRMLFMQPSVFTVMEVDRDSVEASAIQVSNVLHLTAEIEVAVQADALTTSFTTTTVTPETLMTRDTQTEDTAESSVPVEVISGAVGGVVCVLLVVMLVIALTLCARRRKGQQNSHRQDGDIDTTPNDTGTGTALELKENVAYATSSNFEIDCNVAYVTPSNFEMGSNVAYASASNTDREVTEYDYVL